MEALTTSNHRRQNTVKMKSSFTDLQCIDAVSPYSDDLEAHSEESSGSFPADFHDMRTVNDDHLVTDQISCQCPRHMSRKISSRVE